MGGQSGLTTFQQTVRGLRHASAQSRALTFWGGLVLLCRTWPTVSLRLWRPSIGSRSSCVPPSSSQSDQNPSRATGLVKLHLTRSLYRLPLRGLPSPSFLLSRRGTTSQRRSSTSSRRTACPASERSRLSTRASLERAGCERSSACSRAHWRTPSERRSKGFLAGLASDVPGSRSAQSGSRSSCVYWVEGGEERPTLADAPFFSAPAFRVGPPGLLFLAA